LILPTEAAVPWRQTMGAQHVVSGDVLDRDVGERQQQQ
jgi:hypothetical protein